MKAIELGATLPIGFTSKGKEFKEFELGPVKGRLRRDYLNLRKRSPARETLVALKHVLTRLGPLDKPAEAFMRRLTLPDIDYIFLLICASESEEGLIKWEHTCPEDAGGCGNVNKLSVTPSDVELVDANPAIQFTEDGNPIQITEFEDPITGKQSKIVFRVPTLDDQIKLFDKMSTGNQETFGNFIFHQMANMMIDYDDRGKGLSVDELDDFPVKTVDALLEHNNTHRPTQLDTEVIYSCSQCGMEHTVQLPLDSWLAPFSQ